MHRLIALVLGVFLLTGCKLAVVLVEGGEVQSISSGTCVTAVPGATGSVCIHEVSNTNYSESFTAVPDPGWEFVKWNAGDGFLCADTTSTTCVVDNTSLAGNDFAEAFVATDSTLYIMPIFQPVPAPILDYLGSTKSVSDCISESGEVVEVGGDANGTQVCRFDSATCPVGWNAAAGWSTTSNFEKNWSQPAISFQEVTCNGVSATFISVPSASGTLQSGFHPWLNDSSLESQTCRIVAAQVQEIQGDCSDPGITQAVITSSIACSGEEYTSDVSYTDSSASILSGWARSFSSIQAVASRTQIGCY